MPVKSALATLISYHQADHCSNAGNRNHKKYITELIWYQSAALFWLLFNQPISPELLCSQKFLTDSLQTLP